MVKSCNTLAELEEEILAAGDRLVVTHFFADWSRTCKIVSQEVEKLAVKEKDVVFLQVNIDINKEASELYDINELPTLIFIKGGAKVGKVLGAHLGKLKKAIKKHAPIKEGQFNHDLCTDEHCYLVPCCAPWFLCCAPCLVYDTAEEIGESGILYGLLTCFLPCIGAMLLRRKIRKKYNIEGSDLGCQDAGISCLCTPCVMCQNFSETKESEEFYELTYFQ